MGEEVGDFAGARTTAYSVRPDVAIAIDVYNATDIPEGDPNESGDHPLGKPALGRGAPLSSRVFELLYETAQQEEIETSVEVVTDHTHTDADAYHLSRAGIPLVFGQPRFQHRFLLGRQLAFADPIVAVDFMNFHHNLGCQLYS